MKFLLELQAIITNFILQFIVQFLDQLYTTLFTARSAIFFHMYSDKIWKISNAQIYRFIYLLAEYPIHFKQNFLSKNACMPSDHI